MTQAQSEPLESPAENPRSFSERALEAKEKWEADSPDVISIDTETEGVGFYDPAFAASVAWDDTRGKRLPDREGHYLELYEQTPLEVAREIIRGTPTWVFHNAKFDLQKLILAGIISREDVHPGRIEDTEAIAHLLDEQDDKGLKHLAVRYLGLDDTVEVPLKSDPSRTRKVSKEKYDLDEARRAGKHLVKEGYGVLPREVVIPYAIADAEMTLGLYRELKPRLEAKDEGLRNLYAREMRLSVVLLDIESRGLRIDVPYSQEKAKELARAMFKEVAEIQKLADKEGFKDHHVWIKDAFTGQGITLANTQAETLEEMEGNKLAERILEYRRLKKLHDYFMAIERERKDDILHPHFRQHGTRTGRMSSGGAID